MSKFVDSYTFYKAKVSVNFVISVNLKKLTGESSKTT